MFYRKKEWLSPLLVRLPMVITISLFVLFTVSCSKTSGKAVDNASLRPLSVRVLPVEQKQVRRNIESVGSLFPLDEVTVSSEVEGRVDQVLVDVGDHVSAGQTIVKVVQTELQLTLDQQRASLQQARARLGLQASGDDSRTCAPLPRSRKPRPISPTPSKNMFVRRPLRTGAASQTEL